MGIQLFFSDRDQEIHSDSMTATQLSSVIGMRQHVINSTKLKAWEISHFSVN